MTQQQKKDKKFSYDTIKIVYLRKGKKVREFEEQVLIPSNLVLSDTKRIFCEAIYVELLQLNKKQLEQIHDVYHVATTHPHRKAATHTAPGKHLKTKRSRAI